MRFDLGSSFEGLADEVLEPIAHSVPRPEELVYFFAIAASSASFRNFDARGLFAIGLNTFFRDRLGIPLSHYFATLLHFISACGDLRYLNLLLNEFEADIIPVRILARFPRG